METNDSALAERRRRRIMYRSQRFGISINSALTGIKSFALACFDHLDVNKDGFLSYEEMKAHSHDPATTYQERLCLRFLLIHRHEIQKAYQEPNCENSDQTGISREDLILYFSSILNKNLVESQSL